MLHVFLDSNFCFKDPETLTLIEKQAIQNALAVTNGNKLEAAKLLGNQ